MSDRDAIDRRLHSWLEEGLATLRPENPVHIHANELLGRKDASDEEWLSTVQIAFVDAIDILGDRLREIMPVVMVPLTSTDEISCSLPRLDRLELGDEIPSIYLIDRNASKYFAKFELYRRFLNDFTLFDPHLSDVFFFYEVFRPDQQREWGWEYTRTIKGEHYLPEHRVD